MISKTILVFVAPTAAVQLKSDVVDHVSIDIADQSDGVIEVPRQADTSKNKKRDGAKEVSVKVINNNEQETAALVTRPRTQTSCCDCDCILTLLFILFIFSPFLYLIYSYVMIDHFGDDCASMKKYKAFWMANMKGGGPCCINGTLITDPHICYPRTCYDTNGTVMDCEDYYNDLYNVTGLDWSQNTAFHG